jgi:hypothetical protein
MLSDLGTLHLQRGRARKFWLRPDRPASNVLMGRQVAICLSDDRRRLCVLVEQEDGPHLDVGVSARHPNDDCVSNGRVP